jgi:hypothetical protein
MIDQLQLLFEFPELQLSKKNKKKAKLKKIRKKASNLLQKHYVAFENVSDFIQEQFDTVD